jgi:L-seryl-tRNA(Ser) seleniumtransferase
VLAAAGTTDVELDLATGRRGRRGAGALGALAAAAPDAGAVHVVNNGAAALVLAATALAAGKEIVLSRGEMVEIGDGFRIPDLLVSTGARLREVGTTNRVTLADYAAAVGPDTGFVLKLHPSNFAVSGFTAAVPADRLASLDAPLVVDIGSGLLAPSAVLPDEPDAATALRAGAALVTASGDKLLGGPQAGLLLGRAEVVERLRRHPLARALRVDKLTLAALEATLRGPAAPVARFLAADPVALRVRADRLAGLLRAHRVDATAVDSEAAVGGGGAPGVVLPSAAVSLPEPYAAALRAGDPPVLGRVAGRRCLVDLRAVDETDDRALQRAILAVRV